MVTCLVCLTHALRNTANIAFHWNYHFLNKRVSFYVKQKFRMKFPKWLRHSFALHEHFEWSAHVKFVANIVKSILIGCRSSKIINHTLINVFKCCFSEFLPDQKTRLKKYHWGNSVTKNCYCCDNIKNMSDRHKSLQSFSNKALTVLSYNNHDYNDHGYKDQFYKD